MVSNTLDFILMIKMMSQPARIVARVHGVLNTTAWKGGECLR